MPETTRPPRDTAIQELVHRLVQETAAQGLNTDRVRATLFHLLDAFAEVATDDATPFALTPTDLQSKPASLSKRLEDLLGLIERREAAWKYTEAGWRQRRAALEAQLSADPESAVHHWLALYAEALVDWQLDTCRALVDEPFAFPDHFVSDVFLFKVGTEALLTEEYVDTLDMLNYLIDTHQEQPWNALHLRHCALLRIFRGRIHQTRLGDRSAARADFEQAEAMLPRDGRPQAAWGHYYRDQHAPGQSTAHEYFTRAIEYDPDRPEGYVGLGLLAEDDGLLADDYTGWRSEADDWYRQALETLENDPKPQLRLHALLFPVSGNLLVQLASVLKHEQKLDAALDAVNEALDQGLRDETDYPERIAYRVKGAILDSLGRPTEAAAAFFQAGQRYYWLNKSDKTVHALRKATALDPDHVDAHWYLADTLRIQSHSAEWPYVNPQLIEESLETWQRGADLNIPQTSDSAWSYLARTIIEEQLARVPAEDSPPHWWRAIIFVEQALLFASDTNRWARLAALFRYLGANFNALHAAERAAAYDRDELLTDELLFALQERAGALINIGRYEEADSLLDTLIADSPSESVPVYQSWRAVICHYQRRFEEGIALVQPQIEADTEEHDLWTRRVRADLYRLNGNTERAATDFRWIWERRFDDAFREETLSFGWAGLILGHYPECLAFFDDAVRDPASGYLADLSLGLCRLTFDPDAPHSAAPHLDAALQQAHTHRELDNMEIECDYIQRRARAEAWPHRDQVRAFLNAPDGFLQQIAARRTEIPTADSPAIAELQRVLERVDAQPSAPHWIAAHAALGRLYRAHHRWANAAAEYRILSEYPDAFREAERGLRTVATALIDTAKSQLQAGTFGKALEHLDTALELNLDAFTPLERAHLHSLKGSAHIGRGHTADARSAFTDALARYADHADADPGETLATVCSASIHDVAHYWALHDAWSAWAHPPNDEPAQAFAQAQQALHAYWTDFFQLNAADDLQSIVTPIVVELGSNLIPQVPDDEWVVLTTFVPNMRTRIERDQGISVPSIRFRGNEDALAADAYLILLEETPIVTGSVRMDRVFCPSPRAALQPMDVPDEAIIEAFNPVDEQPGCWVDPAYADAIAAHGAEVWSDPREYMIRHLEQVLRRNASNFVGVHEVEDLLQSWANNPNDASASALIAQVLPNATKKLRFGRVLRALLDEQVSIADWPAIIESVTESGLASDDIHADLRAARLRLKPHLPGNRPGDTRVPVPPSIEQAIRPWIHTEGDTHFLAIPPGETQELLSELRGVLEAHASDVVLIARDAYLRPFLRRLIAFEFPTVHVIASDELLPIDSDVAEDTAEAADALTATPPDAPMPSSDQSPHEASR